jgi:hypothetical protein
LNISDPFVVLRCTKIRDEKKLVKGKKGGEDLTAIFPGELQL